VSHKSDVVVEETGIAKDFVVLFQMVPHFKVVQLLLFQMTRVDRESHDVCLDFVGVNVYSGNIVKLARHKSSISVIN
jgi:hypothetical protein